MIYEKEFLKRQWLTVYGDPNDILCDYGLDSNKFSKGP